MARIRLDPPPDIRHLIRQSHQDAIVTVLGSLAEGMAKWIGDEDELLLEQEHHDIVSGSVRLSTGSLFTCLLRLFHYILTL